MGTGTRLNMCPTIRRDSFFPIKYLTIMEVAWREAQISVVSCIEGFIFMTFLCFIDTMMGHFSGRFYFSVYLA